MKNNKKKTLLALLLFLIFGAGAIAFVCSGSEENIAEMLIPTILFSFFSLILIIQDLAFLYNFIDGFLNKI